MIAPVIDLSSVARQAVSRIDLGGGRGVSSSEFAALRYFALNGTDHRGQSEQSADIGAYIRRHNLRAEAKTNSAPDSPICTWTDYPANAA
ncbi:hypothetical protein ACIBBE_28050 [Streptomyces sp. NPDC051644]|uniref:hypothetical protein n=1 Tax=Streptomyces sp. NPDC051644 TaxID=3365666 RepID=UPI00379B7999